MQMVRRKSRTFGVHYIELRPNTKAHYQGVMWNGNGMHRKVMKRIISTEPDVVNHLEYDNRRNNLMDCDTSYNMRDIYGRSAYSILNDCKWCQDLYLLYMTDAITPEEFMYLRLLRLSCFPAVVSKCIGHTDTQHQGLLGVCLTYDLFDKYGIKVQSKGYLNNDDRLFRQEPLSYLGYSDFKYQDNIFSFARDLQKDRLRLYPKMNLEREDQVTFIDNMILSEFIQVYLSHGGNQDVLYNAIYDYLMVCNYRYRFLSLVRSAYKIDSAVLNIERAYTLMLENTDCMESYIEVALRPDVFSSYKNFGMSADNLISSFKRICTY